jgi:hypothetical protein
MAAYIVSFALDGEFVIGVALEPWVTEEQSKSQSLRP